MQTYNNLIASYVNVMGRVKGSKVNKSAEILKMEGELRELRAKERNKGKVEGAREYLAQYEQEYQRCKTVFFGVNGARRILKNA